MLAESPPYFKFFYLLEYFWKFRDFIYQVRVIPTLRRTTLKFQEILISLISRTLWAKLTYTK